MEPPRSTKFLPSAMRMRITIFILCQQTWAMLQTAHAFLKPQMAEIPGQNSGFGRSDALPGRIAFSGCPPLMGLRRKGNDIKNLLNEG